MRLCGTPNHLADREKALERYFAGHGSGAYADTRDASLFGEGIGVESAPDQFDFDTHRLQLASKSHSGVDMTSRPADGDYHALLLHEGLHLCLGYAIFLGEAMRD